MELIRYVRERNWPVIAGSVALVLSAAIGLGGVLLTRMGTRTYALGKASVAIGGDEQQVFTPTDPVTR